MWQKTVKFFKTHRVLLAIVALSGFLRFWNLCGLLHFTLDEELEAFIVKNIITGYHFPAIGVFAAPLGIHLSPVFYYLAAIPFWIGGGDPLVWGVTASLLGVLTTAFIYFANKEMFSRRVAVFSGLLYAASFLAVMYDKHFWNVSPMPFLAIAVVYSLYKIFKRKLGWVIPLSAALAIGVTAHLSSLGLILFTVLAWIKGRLPLFRKQIVTGLIFALLLQLPLVIFELRHNFLQTKTVLEFLAGEHGEFSLARVSDNLLLLPRVFSRLIYTFGPHDFAREHTYGWAEIALRDVRTPAFMIVAAVLVLIFFLSLAYRNRKNIAYGLHGVLVLVTAFCLLLSGILFKGGIFEYYLAFLFPSLFTVLALTLDWIWKRGKFYPTLAVLLSGIFLLFNVYAVLTSYHSYGLSKKMEVISWVSQRVGDAPFELHSIGVDHKYEGYRYLFEKYYKAPVKSFVDPQLAWLYQSPVSATSPNIMVVITSTEKDYQDKIKQEMDLYLPFIIEEKQFG